MKFSLFKKVKSILSLVLLLSLLPLSSIVYAAADFAGGDGSEGNPFQIATPAQLDNVRNHLEPGKYFILTSDIDLGNTPWIPIAYGIASGYNYSVAFLGNFSGNGHTISNLNVETTGNEGTGWRRPGGLFGHVGNGGIIENLKLVNVDVRTTANNDNYLGGLVGESDGLILNCSVTEGTGVYANGSRNTAGGLVGMQWDHGKIVNCYTDIPVSAINGETFAGGMVGCSGSNAVIANSYARGNVTGTGADRGGLIGINYSIISNCYATGLVNGGYEPLAKGAGDSFNVVADSAYYLSTVDGVTVVGYSGISAADATLKSNGFVNTLNINRSCISGLIPSNIVLHNWQVSGGMNDGYPILVEPSLNDATAGVAANISYPYSGGNGTSGSPYLISTKSDLVQLAVNTNSGSITTTDQYFSLANNINLEGLLWTPIGTTAGTAFNGVFDYNGYYISNFTLNPIIQIPTSQGGIFGYPGINAQINNYCAPVAGSGKALDFDGINDYIDVPMAIGANSLPLTMEAWVMPQVGTAQTVNNVISSDSPACYGHGFTVNVYPGGSQLIVEYHNGFRTVPDVTFSAGQWYHVAVVYTNGNYKAYVDGNLADDFSYAQGSMDGVDFIRIGKHNDEVNQYYKGALDEVRVWSTERTQQEIRNNMYKPLTGSEAGLEGYWRFDEGTGTIVYDASPTQNNGTLANMDAAADWIGSEAWKKRTTDEDTPLVIDAGYNFAGDWAAIIQTVPPSNGSLGFDPANKKLTYTPGLNWNGTDNFTYQIGGGTDSSSYAVEVTVIPMEDYTVTYNGNGNDGGSVPIDNNSYQLGWDVSVRGNTGNMVKAGCVFAGWNTEADGSGTDRAVASTFSMGSANVTLYAKWSEVAAPEAPILQSAVAGDGHVNISWSSAAGAAEYKIFQSTISGSYGTPIATVTDGVYSYDAVGLTNGITYYFVIKASNAGGDSPSSAEVNAVPKTVPEAPVNVTAAAGNGQAIVSFTAPSYNGGSPITGYVVASNPGSITAAGTDTPITVTGLTNGTAYTFTVKAVNTVGNSVDSAVSNAVTPRAPSGGSSNHTTPSANNTGTDIFVNGKAESAGTTLTTREGEKTVITIAVDEMKLEQKLEQEGSNAVVTIPINAKADVVVNRLNGQTVKNMETREAVLEIKTANVTYTLPASQINIDRVSEQIGSQVELKNIKVSVTIAEPPRDTVRIIEDTANKNSYQIVVKPVEFNITCTSGDKTIEVSRFNGYVERTAAIPEGIDPGKITTGIVLNPDGTFSHVPTRIIVIDGKYYAKINSLTNSTYSVIYSPKIFRDVETHWAKDAVNDMGSRLVIEEAGDGRFEPDRDITRAEFAAVIVRALGLKPEIGENPFSDINSTDLNREYIQTAYEYGIISGYGNREFGLMDKTTREQAITMIARAMKITGLKVDFTDGEAEKLLSGFEDADQSVEYAKNGISVCVKAGVVNGRNGNLIAPKDSITRAETAVIARRLLQKSKLIEE